MSDEYDGLFAGLEGQELIDALHAVVQALRESYEREVLLQAEAGLAHTVSEDHIVPDTWHPAFERWRGDELVRYWIDTDNTNYSTGLRLPVTRVSRVAGLEQIIEADWLDSTLVLRKHKLCTLEPIDGHYYAVNLATDQYGRRMIGKMWKIDE